MRTVFVNPTRVWQVPANLKRKKSRPMAKSAKKSRKRRRRRRPAASMAPKRRKRRRVSKSRSYTFRRKRGSRKYSLSVRKNAGITPFVSSDRGMSFMNPRRNPMILQNPRRRRRRKNPFGLSKPSFKLEKLVPQALGYLGGAAIGSGVNILGFRRVENDWLRNGGRVVVATLGAAFLPPAMGGAMAGATLFPLFSELALMTNLVGPAPAGTEADLSSLAADLQDVLGNDELALSDDELVLEDDDDLFS